MLWFWRLIFLCPSVIVIINNLQQVSHLVRTVQQHLWHHKIPPKPVKTVGFRVYRTLRFQLLRRKSDLIQLFYSPELFVDVRQKTVFFPQIFYTLSKNSFQVFSSHLFQLCRWHSISRAPKKLWPKQMAKKRLWRGRAQFYSVVLKWFPEVNVKQKRQTQILKV